MHSKSHSVQQFDAFITRKLTKISPSFKTFFRAVTFVGSPFATLFVAGSGALIGFMSQNTIMLTVFLLAIGATLLVNLIKVTVRRPRPLTKYANNMALKTFSFPSGHSSSSTIIYGTILLALTNYLPPVANIIVCVIVILFIASIGVSRVFLGAHYASDVVGGWIIGSIILVLLWPLAVQL